MKTFSKIAAAVIVILSLLLAAPAKVKAQFSASISIETFYSELAPYGQWVDDPEYGYVWIPDVQSGFRPYYSGGHWVMTSYGAMWVSNYTWGWAPFHYGRWVYTSFYGWVWIPDTTWGPAWVTWRWGNDYCGWAPLGPGISVSASFGGYSVPNDWWVFVPQRYCLSPNFYNYRIAPQQNVTYVKTTTIVNNTYVNNNVTYVAGPRVADVKQVTGGQVPVYNVSNVSQPGKTSLTGGAVRIYRPEVTRKENARPPKVVTKDQFIKNKPDARVQPSQQLQRKVEQQNMNRQMKEERRQVVKEPPQQQIQQQQSNGRRMNEQRHQPIQQPVPQQTEKRPVQQPPVQQQNNNNRDNNNRQVQPQRHEQPSQPPSQRNEPPTKPVKKGKGNG